MPNDRIVGVIESERLILRPIAPGDVELLVNLDSDPEVMRYLTGRPSTRREVEAVLENWRFGNERGCRASPARHRGSAILMVSKPSSPGEPLWKWTLRACASC